MNQTLQILKGMAKIIGWAIAVALVFALFAFIAFAFIIITIGWLITLLMWLF